MKQLSTHSLLKKSGFRDTQPRRTVLAAFKKIRKPVSPYDVQKWLKKQGTDMNAVTIYRVIAVLEKLGLVHKHALTGLLSYCTKPELSGHHGFLHCKNCEKYEEFHSEDLCRTENKIARRAGYIPNHHISEIIGICRSCQTS